MTHTYIKKKYETDVLTYSNGDSGCKYATDYLVGEQSHCLSCPFPKCVADMTTEERRKYLGTARGMHRDEYSVRPRRAIDQNREIIKLRDKGKTPTEISGLVGVSKSHIYRILREAYLYD